MERLTRPRRCPTHDLVPYITLHHNLILPLRVLGHRASGRKLASKELCYLLQVKSKGVETVDVGGVFPSRPFRALDDDLEAGSIRASSTADGSGCGSAGEDRGHVKSKVELSEAMNTVAVEGGGRGRAGEERPYPPW
jgi:hypothetical protein